MTTENFKSVEARTVEASRIAREACENAYREGFEAGAKAMRESCVDRLHDEENTRGHAASSLSQSGWLHIMHAIESESLPTPTTKG